MVKAGRRVRIDRVHHCDRIPSPDDPHQVLDAAVAYRRLSHPRRPAAAGGDRLFSVTGAQTQTDGRMEFSCPSGPPLSRPRVVECGAARAFSASWGGAPSSYRSARAAQFYIRAPMTDIGKALHGRYERELGRRWDGGRLPSPAIAALRRFRIRPSCRYTPVAIFIRLSSR